MKTRRTLQGGASLVEIVVAVAVLTVGLYAIAQGLQASRAGAAVARDAAAASVMACNVVEMLQADGAEVRRAIQGKQSAQLPPEGPRPWPTDDRYQWVAKIEQVPDAPLARVEVQVTRAKAPEGRPLAVATGILSLSEGGTQ